MRQNAGALQLSGIALLLPHMVVIKDNCKYSFVRMIALAIAFW